MTRSMLALTENRSHIRNLNFFRFWVVESSMNKIRTASGCDFAQSATSSVKSMFSEFRKVNDLISSSILYEENSWSKRFNHLEADILSISEKISENKKVEQVD